jgi:hemolysin III
MNRARVYTDGEEWANTISHAFGILLGVAAAWVLLNKAFAGGSPWEVGSVLIYLFGMLSCYVVSTAYHGSKEDGRWKQKLQKLDHALIYVHIAGTYTPFTLIPLRMEGAWGWTLFSFVWLAAIAGVLVSFRKSLEHSYTETVCYVAMGCIILIALKPLIEVLGRADQISALYWLIGGGVSYIVGAIFYSLARQKYMHTVFHLFVLGGSVCHIIAIYIIL